MTNINLTNNLTISRDNAIAAYDNTNDAVRELLKHLFGEEVFTKGITERVKTFEDAREALGDEHPLVKEYWGVVNVDLDITQDLIAYLKLRIITAALNEGWEPQFTEDECRYSPPFEFKFFTQREINDMSDYQKSRMCSRAYHMSEEGCLVCAYVGRESSFTYGTFGTRLALKNIDLADYAGRQFIELYADFIYGLHFSRKSVK